MDISLTPTKPLHRKRRDREQAAARTARWRERTATTMPDVRALDQALVEAFTLHVMTFAPEQAKAILRDVRRMAAEGLAFRGYDAVLSKKRAAGRLKSWLDAKPNTGCVRAALERSRVQDSVTA